MMILIYNTYTYCHKLQKRVRVISFTFSIPHTVLGFELLHSVASGGYDKPVDAHGQKWLYIHAFIFVFNTF